ncbi:hypothetical protein Emag_002525 [Eimeria magna]
MAGLLLRLSPLLLGLQKQSIVRCCDGAGIVKACIIGLGNRRHGGGKPGDRVRLSVRDRLQQQQQQQQKMPLGLIVRSRKERRRKDGSYISFGDNACILISKNKLAKGPIKGPVPFDISHNSKLSAEILL